MFCRKNLCLTICMKHLMRCRIRLLSSEVNEDAGRQSVQQRVGPVWALASEGRIEEFEINNHCS
jgi:hypothetical protein